MQRAILGAVAVALLVAACGTDPSLDSSGPDVSSITDSPLASPGSVDVTSCPNFVTEVETGIPPEGFTEDGPIARAQNRLHGDVEAVRAYGEAHPDTFASLRFENAPWVRLVVGFTGDIETHCAALRSLLEYADEFQIISQPMSEVELLAALDEVVAMAGEYLQGAGMGAGDLSVDLRADGTEPAGAIRERFGEVVTITVGGRPYPAATDEPGIDCSAYLHPEVEDPGFVATVRLDSPTVRSGEDFSGWVDVTNDGDTVLSFESGRPLTALVYLPGGQTPVGVYTGGISGTGIGAELEPGESLEIDFIGGTASCDPELGYAVPPGEYEVRVPVDQYFHPGGAFELRVVLSEPAPLTITP